MKGFVENELHSSNDLSSSDLITENLLGDSNICLRSIFFSVAVPQGEQGVSFHAPYLHFCINTGTCLYTFLSFRFQLVLYYLYVCILWAFARFHFFQLLFLTIISPLVSSVFVAQTMRLYLSPNATAGVLAPKRVVIYRFVDSTFALLCYIQKMCFCFVKMQKNDLVVCFGGVFFCFVL